MKIDILKINKDNDYLIDETINLEKSFYQNTEIRSLSPISVKGSISRKEDAMFYININVNGEMILPCSVSLVDVKYPFNIEINEVIDLFDEESEDYLKIIDNTIDIIPIMWQNIVVEIPMKVVSPDLDRSKIKGDGWELLTEDEKMTEIDPRLNKLRDLLDD